MKLKCRILSIFVIVVSVITITICAIVVANKKNNEPIYATNINFVGNIKGVEIIIDNDLVLNDDLVKIEPSNCTFTPEYTIKRYNDSYDEAVAITEEKYSFESVGSYIISCKIKANENYYLSDSLTIKVVSSPDESTSMYIQELAHHHLYVDDNINLNSLVSVMAPDNAEMSIECSDNLDLNHDIVTAIDSGLGTIEVTASYDNFVITKTVDVIVKPKIIENEIDLKLTIGATVLNNNVVEITNADYNISINYELLNIDNQLINCWTNSNIIEIISYNSPTMVIAPKVSGEAIVYISPINYEYIVFEVIVKVNI